MLKKLMSRIVFTPHKIVGLSLYGLVKNHVRMFTLPQANPYPPHPPPQPPLHPPPEQPPPLAQAIWLAQKLLSDAEALFWQSNK